MYKSENEVDKFYYDDCIITEFKITEGKIILNLESLIVRANNSQNANYTDSYAGETHLSFDGGRIVKLVKEGYKYYDANDNLIDEYPDEPVESAESEYEKKFSKVFMIGLINPEDNIYKIRIEMPETEAVTVTDTYEVTISANKAVFTWDRYMNRVQG